MDSEDSHPGTSRRTFLRTVFGVSALAGCGSRPSTTDTSRRSTATPSPTSTARTATATTTTTPTQAQTPTEEATPTQTDETTPTESATPTPELDFVVARDGSGDYTTLSDAHRVARHGDVLGVKAGSYSVELTKQLTIIGAGPSQTTVQITLPSGERQDMSQDLRQLTIPGASGPELGKYTTVQLTGVVVGGPVVRPSAIYGQPREVTVRDSIVRGTVDSGGLNLHDSTLGGPFNGATLRATDSTVEGDISTSYLFLTNSTAQGTVEAYDSLSSYFEATNSTVSGLFEGNTDSETTIEATTFAGGARFSGDTHITAKNCSFHYASDVGAALEIDCYWGTVTECQFSSGTNPAIIATPYDQARSEIDISRNTIQGQVVTSPEYVTDARLAVDVIGNVFKSPSPLNYIDGKGPRRLILNSFRNGDVRIDTPQTTMYREDEGLGNYYSAFDGSDENGDGIIDLPRPIPGEAKLVDRYPLANPAPQVYMDQAE